MALEIITRKLSPKLSSFQAGVGGKPEISQTDLAAMLAGIPQGASELAYAALLQDPVARRRLYARMHLIACDWAIAEAWVLPKSSERLRRLAMMVVEDLCDAKELRSERVSAAYLGITRCCWRCYWKDRHYRLLSVGIDWEGDLRRKIGREMKIDY